MKRFVRVIRLSLILLFTCVFFNESYTQCPYAIDQQQGVSNIGVYGTNQWQSFIAGGSQRMGSIDLYSNAAYAFNGNITLRLYSGTGTGGSQIYTNIYYFDTVPSGWIMLEIPWGSAPTLSSGSSYTLRVQTSNNLYLRASIGNTYSNGHYYSNVYGTYPGWDLMFRNTWGDKVSIVHNLLGDTEYCENGPYAAVWMDDTETGINYKLYRDGVFVQTSSGSGYSKNFSPQSTEGNYTVIAQNPFTTCTYDMQGDIDIVEILRPVVGAGADDTLCGYQYTLQGTLAENYSSINWTSTGSGTFDNSSSLTPTYTATDADLMDRWVELILTAQPNSPCLNAESDTMLLRVFERADAGINDTICKGTDFLLNGSFYGDVPLHDTMCIANCDMPQYCLSNSINAWYINIYSITVDDSMIVPSLWYPLGFLGLTDSVYTTIIRDSIFELKISTGNYYQFPENISAFFDWNRDGDFEDEDETVGYNSFNKQYNTFAADILVPPGAILGEINMRIIYTVDSVINPCGTYYIGQTVDVKINVMAKAPDYDIWFDWTGPNAFTSTQQRPILQDVSIYEAGNYHLEMTNQFGCVSTADIDLTILPKDTITPDTSICFGDTVLLTLTGPDAYMQTYSFEWSTGSTNDSIIVSPLVTTTYYVTVTGTTCTVVDEVVVTVHPLPVVDLGNDTSLCRWTLIEIDTNYVSYDWNNGMTDTYFFDLDTAGSYHVVVVDTNTCTNTSDTVNISVLETPASFTGLANNYLTNASPATLTGSPTGGTFSGSGISGNTFTPVNAGLGIHDITYTYVDATPCSNTETQNTQVYANDLSMISILSPETGYLTAAETVTVQIKNRGLNSVDNMIVSFQAAATGINISESVSQSIAPDDTLTYTFLQTVDMSTEEEYFCTASVTTPGDEIASNDSLNVSITNYVGSNCMNPFMYTFTSNNIPTINDSITAINWYKFTLDSAYINFSFAFTPNPAWANMDVDIWEDCSLNNEIIPDNSTILPASITLNFDTIWQGTYIVRVTGSGDYSLDVTGYNGIYGCTNPNSPSYNPAADFDDGSCQNISYDCGVNPLPPFNPIPAQISTDINWNTDSIIINCDVDILDGVTVTVAPGTVVLFNTSAKINVEGTFVAIGNMLDSIIFKADNQFMGCQFVFDNGPVPGAAGAMSNNDTSRFEYCIFTKNRVDDLLIRIDNFSRLVIRNNHFTENIVSTYTTGNHGLILCENSSQPIISTNLFNLNLLQCFPSDIGGIIVCENSDPLIAYNNLTFNSVHSNLAGVIVCLNSSDPEITRNHIIANLNAGDGAGAILCLTNSNPNVSQNLVMENLIGSDIVGGAIFCFDASGIFTENIVSHNLGQLGGGFCCVASEVEIDNNIIQFNIAAAINTTGGNGGGIGIYDGSHVIISNCLIHANKALLDNTSSQSSGMGGGIYINDSEIDMYNNVISFNDGIMGGGIAASDSARVNCTNNTICNNFSYGGGAMLCVEANTTFTNTIIYYNHSLLDGQIYILDTTINEINLVHCNIEGGQNGIVNPSGVFYANTYQNNIDIAPYFVDETAFNFELQFQSACINGGTLDTTGLGIPQNDIFGTPRILNDTIDIGAFEATRIGTCSNITENTVWNADTVCVACDIMVRDSATLTIDPGTVVEFLGSYKIDVQGRLLAVGTESDSILFTVADTTDFHDFGLKDGGWQGLQFDNGPLGAYGDMDDNDSSIISYCKINYAKKVNNYINGFSYLVDELLTYNTYGIDTFDMGFIWNLDTAFDKGGAIYVNNLSKLKISNSDISNNKAYMGGSVYCENNASPIITNTRICNNEAKTYGGGVFITGSSPKITNSIICNNSALEQTGGGISCYFSMPEFTNLTVSNNSGLYQAGVVFMGSAPIIKNSIFWGNSNIDSDFPVFQNDSIQTDTILIDSVLNISYSNIQGFSGGIENISSPPLFISPSSGTGSGYDALSANWSLYPESPCVNAGTPDTTGLALPTTDLGDGARIQNDTIDMGAYETLRIPGCTNPAGLNYDPLANYDDGSCEFSGEDCGQAINYGTVNDPAISGLVLQNSDKWAYFTINVDYKSVTISLCGSNFDTEMELYEDCDSTNYFAFNDNFCGAKSQITLDTLVQGIYYVRILGVGLANGSFDLEITGTEILNTSLSATHVTCYGYSDGIVDMTISGGASPFTIEWSNGMTMEDLVDIVAGTYNVTVTDTESSTSINSMTITQPDAPTRDYDIRHVVCHGDSTGEIDLTIDGDFPPFTFEWPGGATSEDRTVLFAGTYDLTITDDDGCLINDDITVNQTDLIVPGFVKNNVSCHGDSDGDIDLSVSGGIPPFAFEWSFSFDTTFLETTEDLSLLAYGTYYLTITDDSACQVNNFAIIFEPDILALSITGTSVSIAGASDGIADLTVTGGTMPYSYLWSNDSTSQDINAIPEGAYTVTVTDDKACTETASVYISEPPVNITQSISLPQDWSIFSTYINPPEPGIDSVLNDIVSNVTIVKDEDGNVYWPFYTTDLIGDITIGKGYQIKMLVADILEILGPSVIPENTHLIINEGWGLTGYLRHPTGPIADMLSTIVEEIIIVKNGAGLIFWPQYNVNIIGNMNPGEAYKIKMESVETLTYPSNNYSSAKFAGTIPIPKYYSGIKNSDKDMTLCIPLDAWNIEPERGDEIGVFSQSGKLVGSGVFSNGNLALSIWGADNYSFDNNGLTDGEKFIVKLWDESENGEETLEIVSWTEGDDYYANNKIAIVEKINHSSPDSYLDQSIVLYQNIPNPFSGETEIRFYLPEENNLEICIFNVFGEHVETLATGKYGKGNHSIIFSSKNYASGNYYYKIITPDYVGTKSMNILKK